MSHFALRDSNPLAPASDIEIGLSARQRLLPELMENSYPRSRLLQWLSQSRIVWIIAHPVMKTCFGAVTLTGLVALYLGVHHGELMRDHFDESICEHLVDYGLIAQVQVPVPGCSAPDYPQRCSSVANRWPFTFQNR